jgi:hypothetical protein
MLSIVTLKAVGLHGYAVKTKPHATYWIPSRYATARATPLNATASLINYEKPNRRQESTISRSIVRSGRRAEMPARNKIQAWLRVRPAAAAGRFPRPPFGRCHAPILFARRLPTWLGPVVPKRAVFQQWVCQVLLVASSASGTFASASLLWDRVGHGKTNIGARRYIEGEVDPYSRAKAARDEIRKTNLHKEKNCNLGAPI